jgi:hypothetical protein
LKHYSKNPRQISKKEFADLRDSLRKFGDLSGVVHNLITDEIIGGNQRMEVFDIHNAKIEIVERLEKPDDQGTIATGWVWWEGKRYTYRAVSWDERQAAEANIRANKAGGTWDFDILSGWNTEDLLEWGFSEFELGLSAPVDPNAEWENMPEFNQENQLAKRTLLVHFYNDADVQEFAELIEQPITDKTKYVYYPRIEKNDLKSIEYQENES